MLEKLEIDFTIPQIIEDGINDVIRASNEHSLLVDCYQMELMSNIHCYTENGDDLSEDEAQILLNYYCRPILM